MRLEELKKKREALDKSTDSTLNNMKIIADESYRVADMAHNSRDILDDLDREFEQQTGLQGHDIAFLFVATALQLTRIVVINQLTKIEKAGQGNTKEDAFKKLQKKILSKLYDGSLVDERPFYASMEHIVTKPGVPYDTTNPFNRKAIERLLDKGELPAWNFDFQNYLVDGNLGLFKGANHRFATLGHDPIVGLLFGTTNIMTNTITCVKKSSVLGFPAITSNHVIYRLDFKDPRIGIYAPTSVMLSEAYKRAKDEPKAFVASLIKQVIHIGTDLYTPCGIQFPGANLILSNTNVEKITKYISTGDIMKISASAGLAALINLIISTAHALLYNPEKALNQDLYNIRTKRIILYSNTIATSSNLLWVGGNMMAGNERAIKDLDIGGLLITIKHLLTDPAYIRKIKEEFIFDNFNKLIQGEDLALQEVGM